MSLQSLAARSISLQVARPATPIDNTAIAIRNLVPLAAAVLPTVNAPSEESVTSWALGLLRTGADLAIDMFVPAAVATPVRKLIELVSSAKATASTTTSSWTVAGLLRSGADLAIDLLVPAAVANQAKKVLDLLPRVLPIAQSVFSWVTEQTAPAKAELRLESVPTAAAKTRRVLPNPALRYQQTQVLRAMATAILGREAAAQELATWQAKIAAGRTLLALKAELKASPEAQLYRQNNRTDV